MTPNDPWAPKLKKIASDTANENKGKKKTDSPLNGAMEGHGGKMTGELLTGGGIRALPQRVHMGKTPHCLPLCPVPAQEPGKSRALRYKF